MPQYWHIAHPGFASATSGSSSPEPIGNTETPIVASNNFPVFSMADRLVILVLIVSASFSPIESNIVILLSSVATSLIQEINNVPRYTTGISDYSFFLVTGQIDR